jgi:hypothetical protein
METKLEQYKRLTTKEDVAPSGMTFRWRGATSLEIGAAIRSMPTLNGSESSRPGAGTKEDLEIAQAFSRALITACVLEPRVVDGEIAPDGDAIPFSVLTNEDVNWLTVKIRGSVGLSGQEAEKAGRAL